MVRSGAAAGLPSRRGRGGGTREVTGLRKPAEGESGLALVEWPPVRLARGARAAFAQRVPPAELAQLIWDSDTDGPDGAPPGASSCRGARVLWFGVHGLGIELVVGPGRAGHPQHAVRGRLMPPAAGAVALLRDTGQPLDLAPDANGAFEVDGVTPGLLRVRVTRPGRRPLLTAWVLLE